MNRPERVRPHRITSIPPRTALDVLRERVTPQIGGRDLLGDVRRVSRKSTAEKPEYVFQKPSGREKARPEPLYERGGKIEWKAEVIEDYNGKGDLGIILQFAGIRLTEAAFLRGRRYYGPDTTLFYSSVSYRNEKALLILATTGDIFEAQVVPAQKDVSPFFQRELYIPQLTTTHNPASMAVLKNTGLVITGYNPCIAKP